MITNIILLRIARGFKLHVSVSYSTQFSGHHYFANHIAADVIHQVYEEVLSASLKATMKCCNMFTKRINPLLSQNSLFARLFWSHHECYALLVGAI